MAHRFAVYVGDDVYIFDSEALAEEFAETKRREGIPDVKVETEDP